MADVEINGASDTMLDRFSSLPANIIESILERLPLDEAVKTGVLAKKWRHHWKGISSLAFDSEFVKFVLSLNKKKIYTFSKIIDRILIFHRGQISKFVLVLPLSDKRRGRPKDISHWMDFLLQNGIKDLNVEYMRKRKSEYLRIPSYVFEGLEHLTLSKCEIGQLRDVKFFCHLNSLKFNKVKITQCSLEAMISQSPHLQELSIVYSPEKDSVLLINAPTLRILRIESSIDLARIQLKNAPDLLLVSLKRSLIVQVDKLKTTKLVEFLSHLPKIEELIIDSTTVQGKSVSTNVTAENIPEMLPWTLENIKRLTMDITCDWESLAINFAFLSCLIRSAPALTSLQLSLNLPSDQTTAPQFEAPVIPDNLSSILQTIRIVDVVGDKRELSLIECLLSSLQMLETMHVEGSTVMSHVVERSLLVKLTQFPRLSPTVEVLYTRFDEDPNYALSSEDESEAPIEEDFEDEDESESDSVSSDDSFN